MEQVTESIDRPVILDNTVLSNFALVDRTDLVMRFWPTRACTTTVVFDEYQLGVSSGLMSSRAWADLPILALTEEETDLAASFSTRLGAGERSCLAAAIRRRGLLASDDLDARRAAQHQNVPLTGTVGILAGCVRQRYLSREEANDLLAEMIALGYHSPIDSLDPLLKTS
jgi:predicted nucleic acid-binding protein